MCGPAEPSCPSIPVNGTMWADTACWHSSCGGAIREETEPLGRSSLAPTWSCLAQLCLLLKLGLPAEGPDLHWAQHTVGVEQG